MSGFLEDKHGIAVTEKAVLAGDGFGVDSVEPVDAVDRAGREESGDETEQGGAGLMEIRDEGVGGAKDVRRIDKDVGLGDVRMSGRDGGGVGGCGIVRKTGNVFREKIFESAEAGGADGDATGAGSD